jgi:hypothetical protein
MRRRKCNPNTTAASIINPSVVEVWTVNFSPRRSRYRSNRWCKYHTVASITTTVKVATVINQSVVARIGFGCVRWRKPPRSILIASTTLYCFSLYFCMEKFVPIHLSLGINLVLLGTLCNVGKQILHIFGERIKMPKRGRVNWANLKFNHTA